MKTESRKLAILLQPISFPVLLGMLLVVGTFAVSRLNPPDLDTWLHIAVGDDILKTGTWPTTESYSFTAYGNYSLAFEWLGQVAMALASRAGGLRGVTALLIGTSAMLMLLLFYYAYLRCGNIKAAFVACVLVLPMMAVFFKARPQVFGYSFLLAVLICLELFCKGRDKALWLLPGLFVLWVNTHGSFVFGFFVLGLYWASGLVRFTAGGLHANRWTENQRIKLELACLLCLVALAITPYGTQLAGFTLHVILNSQIGMTHINEYQSLGAAGAMLKIFLVFLLIFVLSLLLHRSSFRLVEVSFLLVSVYLAWVHLRFLILFVLAFTPLLALLFARWFPPYEPLKDKYVLNAVLMLFIVVGIVKFFPSNGELQEEVAKLFPQAAVEYLLQHPRTGPMLNDDGWGGYLIWAMRRPRWIFIDTRTQLYEDAGVLSDYLSIIEVHRDALILLRKYGIETCLIGRDSPLAILLAASGEWQQLYADDVSALFVRHENARREQSRKGQAAIGNFGN